MITLLIIAAWLLWGWRAVRYARRFEDVTVAEVVFSFLLPPACMFATYMIYEDDKHVLFRKKKEKE